TALFRPALRAVELTLGDFPLALPQRDRQRWLCQGDREIAAVVFHRRGHGQAGIEDATAAVLPIVGIQHLFPVSPVRHTYPIVVPDGRRKVADDDQQVFRVLTLALVDDDAVFPVSVVDPLKSAMIKSILVQSLFRFVKPVQRNDEFAYALMEVIVKKMPVEAVVMIPL